MVCPLFIVHVNFSHVQVYCKPIVIEIVSDIKIDEIKKF